MLVPFLAQPRDPAVDGLLGEIPPDLFSDRLYQACELVERYVSDWTVAIAQRLGIESELATGATARTLLLACGFPPGESPALTWLLARLAAAGHLEETAAASESGEPSYRLARALPTPELADLRALGMAIDPAIAPTLAILDAAGEAFPRVLAGALTGMGSAVADLPQGTVVDAPLRLRSWPMLLWWPAAALVVAAVSSLKSESAPDQSPAQTPAP